jgi:hypothetical protein
MDKGKQLSWAEETGDNTYEFQERVDEAFEEVMEQRGETLPGIPTLLKDAEAIERVLKEPERKTGRPKSDDTDELERELRALGHGSPAIPPRPKGKGKNKPHFSHAQPLTLGPERLGDIDYQESFASQQETAEMREELNGLASRMSHIETILEGLLNERQQLPVHLEQFNIDMTRQLTLMNEKLSSAVEKGLSTTVAQQTAEQITMVASNAHNVLDTIQGDLTADPSPVSRVSQKAPIKGGKKRVKLVQ